jgi:hypothetical protein
MPRRPKWARGDGGSAAGENPKKHEQGCAVVSAHGTTLGKEKPRIRAGLKVGLISSFPKRPAWRVCNSRTPDHRAVRLGREFDRTGISPQPLDRLRLGC